MPSETAAAGSAKMVRFAEVLTRTGLSRTTIWRKIRRGDFPAPIQLGANSVGWPEHEIDQYIANLPRVTYAPDPQEDTAA